MEIEKERLKRKLIEYAIKNGQSVDPTEEELEKVLEIQADIHKKFYENTNKYYSTKDLCRVMGDGHISENKMKKIAGIIRDLCTADDISNGDAFQVSESRDNLCGKSRVWRISEKFFIEKFVLKTILTQLYSRVKLGIDMYNLDLPESSITYSHNKYVNDQEYRDYIVKILRHVMRVNPVSAMASYKLSVLSHHAYTKDDYIIAKKRYEDIILENM